MIAKRVEWRWNQYRRLASPHILMEHDKWLGKFITFFSTPLLPHVLVGLYRRSMNSACGTQRKAESIKNRCKRHCSITGVVHAMSRHRHALDNKVRTSTQPSMQFFISCVTFRTRPRIILFHFFGKKRLQLSCDDNSVACRQTVDV